MIRPIRYKGRSLLAALALAGLLLASILPATHAQDGSAADAAPVSEPDRITSPLNPQGGVYYLDYGGQLLDPANYPITGAQRVVGWSVLNTDPGVYDWSVLDQRIADAKAKVLKLGIMTTVYDGVAAGDIRSTPDYVIKGNDTVVPATESDLTTPNYASYWKRATYNANFDNANHESLWTKTGSVSVVDGPDSGTNYAAKLGGANSATGYIYHYEERIPAMPASLNGTKRVYINANVYIDTSDSAANDHLTMEVWDLNNNKLGGTQVDITNLAHTNKTWKVYTFDVSNFAPEHKIRVAFKVTTNSTNITTFYVDNVELWVRHLIPKYQNASFSDPYVTFIRALGERYRNNADLQYVSFGTGVYGENQPTDTAVFDSVVQNAGLNTQSWTAYCNKVSQAHADAFTAVPGQPPGRSVLLQYAPTYLSVQEREDTTDYAGARKVGLSANFTSPDWTQAFKNDGTGMYDPLQKYLGQAPLSFEAYDSDLCNPVLTFMSMAHALDKKIDYQRVDQALITAQADKDAVAWAKPYFGKTAETTAKVWVLMREHRNPTLTTCRVGGAYYLSPSGTTIWPDLGNFDFYLKQVDSIAGGKTVAETNDKSVDSRYARDPANLANAATGAGLGNCPVTTPAKSYREDLFGANYPCFSQPYNPDLPVLDGQDPNDTTSTTKWYDPATLKTYSGDGKEAYTVRRTDQATGNPYMFFQIDNGYIPGSDTYGAKIAVKYFDIGTDKWSLKYDATSGEKTAGTVTKTGTRTVMTATFTIADGRFGGRLTGGADFYIDSRNGSTNDGNEWIHMVEVERTSTLAAPKAPVVGIAAGGADANLSWSAVTLDVNGKSAVVDHYDVWRSATSPYFTPNAAADVPYANVFTTGFADVGVLNSAGAYYYTVTSVNSSPSALSNRTGKFSYSLSKGQ